MNRERDPGVHRAERSPGRRSRLRQAVVIAAVLAVPLAALGWVAATQLEERERERVDSRLAAGTTGSGGGTGDRDVGRGRGSSSPRANARGAAGRRPGRPRSRRARSPALSGARRLRRRPAADAGRGMKDAIERTVDVLGPSQRRLGRSRHRVTLDRELLRRLQRRAGVPLLLESHNDSAGAGSPPQTITVGGRRYRALAATLPGEHGRLVALVPAGPLDIPPRQEAAARRRLAGLATLLPS